MADPTTARTVEEIENSVSEASLVAEAYSLNEDIHAIIKEEDIGAFYAAVRQTEADADMLRDNDQIRGFLSL
jgi:hypothetical protein